MKIIGTKQSITKIAPLKREGFSSKVSASHDSADLATPFVVFSFDIIIWSE
ncbi:MAG TPA: hypothetical protein PKE69_09855 [Pyrinomonadaceae bacterium]|nr:hypothetical protein [Pyrinomonadaceae bacterium]